MSLPHQQFSPNREADKQHIPSGLATRPSPPMNVRSCFAKALRVILAGGFWAGIFFASTATAAEPEVKGFDVAKVTYKGPTGGLAFTQSGPKEWKGPERAYTELERDEWSVYLVSSKWEINERVQLDLYTKQVNFLRKDGDKSFPLTGAWAAADPTKRKKKQVND